MKKDHWQAWAYWYDSAKYQNARAQLHLGWLYLSDLIAKNESKAKYYFGLACKNAETQGCDMYRKLTEKGIE